MVPDVDTPVRRFDLSGWLARTPRWVAPMLGGCALLLALLTWCISPTTQFPDDQLIAIPADATAGEFAQALKASGALRFEWTFLLSARVLGAERTLHPGVYHFAKPISAPALALRIGNGEFGVEPVRVTLTEGMTVNDMATTLSANLPSFNQEAFLAAASTSEGYLFPDTYFVLPGESEENLVIRLRTRFANQIASITPELMSSKYSMEEIVIMASLLEREAIGLEDKRLVAGILWNRIEIDMPLQVDAVFGYIHGRNGYTPTGADLVMESPYNTYRNIGLPPTPIANPGLESLLAAATPTPTDYFFYLTGRDGLMYYAEDFEGHKINRVNHLD